MVSHSSDHTVGASLENLAKASWKDVCPRQDIRLVEMEAGDSGASAARINRSGLRNNDSGLRISLSGDGISRSEVRILRLAGRNRGSAGRISLPDGCISRSASRISHSGRRISRSEDGVSRSGLRISSLTGRNWGSMDWKQKARRWEVADARGFGKCGRKEGGLRGDAMSLGMD